MQWQPSWASGQQKCTVCIEPYDHSKEVVQSGYIKTHAVPSLIRAHILPWTGALIRGMASLEGASLVVFYYLYRCI